MDRYSLIHLGDEALLRDLAALIRRDRATTASLLAHLAEVDARKLYLPAAYPSMFEYCVRELHLSEDSAYKRIRAARTARQFPAVFPALAEGRLNLNAVVLLSSHLTAENADELLDAATHKTRSDIEQLIAERFPRSEALPLVSAIPGAPDAPEHAGAHPAEPVSEASCQLAARPVEPSAPRAKVAPIAPQRFELRFTVGQEAYELLCYAQELLSHQVEPGDIAGVFERSLKALIPHLEKRKFGATRKPQPKRRPNAGRRHIPAHVKRAVWQRDGGRCTFVSETGRRCHSRTRLEYDHVDPVARGGEATVAGLRLRCRAHNQFAAECAFGVEFMEDRRRAAGHAAEERRRAAAALRHTEAKRRKADAECRRAAAEEAARRAAEEEARTRAAADEVVPWLRQLGLRADAARRAAAACASMPDAPLDQRVRAALACHGRARFHVPATGP